MSGSGRGIKLAKYDCISYILNMKRIGLFFGGLSNEHEISVLSALNIAKYFDNKKNKLVPIFWDKNGEFFITPDIRNLKNRKKETEWTGIPR